MIQLEVGKWYEVRSPESAPTSKGKIKISRKFIIDQKGFEFTGNDGFTYRADGTFLESGKECEFDLIKEVQP